MPHKSSRPKPDQHVLTAAKGGGILFTGRLFTYASRFGIAFLLARFLGAEQYGLYNLSLTAITLAGGLALLGLDSALVRYVALLNSRKDEAGLWGALQIGLGITAVLSVLTGIGLYVLAKPIANQLFDEPQLAPLLRFASVIVPFLALSDVLAGATRGFKKMQYTVIAQNIFQPSVRLVLVLILAIIGLNTTGALIIFGVATVVAVVLLLYFLHKQFSLKRSLRNARYDTREILNFSIPVYLSELMIKFRANVQIILLGALNNVTNVGIFAVASQINLLSGMFQASVTTSTKPIFAELYEQSDLEQMKRLYQTTAKWMFTLNLPIFLMTILFPIPLLSIFGKSFTMGALVLTILAWAKLMDVSTGMCGAVLDMTGYSKLKLVNSIGQLVLSLSLNVLLIPRWGMVGAATTALVVTSVVNLMRLIEVFILFRLLPYNLSFLKPITAGLTTLAAVLMVSQWLPAEANFIYAATNILILFVIYSSLVLLLGISPEDRMVLNRLRRRTNKILPKN